MSKERARRREARQAEIAAKAAARGKAEAAEARRRARRQQLLGLVPAGFRRGRRRSTGLLAAKRRRAIGLLGLAFMVTQMLTWAYTPDWPTRAAVLFASIFIFPLIGVFVL